MPQQIRSTLLLTLVLSVLAAPHAARAMCREVTKQRLARDLPSLLDCYAKVGDELRSVDLLLRRASESASAQTATQVQVILGLGFLSLEAAARQSRDASNKLYDLATDPDVEENANTLYERVSALEAQQAELETMLYRVAEQVVELSSGQRQRVAIARALLEDPELIIADEPTSGAIEELRDKVARLDTELKAEANAWVMLGSGEDRILDLLRDAYLDFRTSEADLVPSTLEGDLVPGEFLRSIGDANAIDTNHIAWIHTNTTQGEPSRTVVRHRPPDATQVVIEVEGKRGKETFEGLMIGSDTFVKIGPDTPFLKLAEGVKGAGAVVLQAPIDHRRYGPAALVEGLKQEEVRSRGFETCPSAQGERCHVIAFLDAGRVNKAYFREDHRLDSIVGGDENGDRRIVLEYTQVEIEKPKDAIELTGDPGLDRSILLRYAPPR